MTTGEIRIPLTKGYFTVIDAEDFDLVSRFTWSASIARTGLVYAAAYGGVENSKRFNVKMHRVILSAQKGEICDHMDGDTLNNRRSNLRICSLEQNARNSKSRSNARSKYKGITFDPARNQWNSRIRVDGKRIFLGRFVDEALAAAAYDIAAKEHFREFARLNFKEMTGG